MTDKDELREIAYDILREIYDEAEPGLDFDEVLENPNDQPDDWFSQHYLSEERQNEIYEKHCDKHDLSQSERNSVHWTAIFQYGPLGHRKPDAEA